MLSNQSGVTPSASSSDVGAPAAAEEIKQASYEDPDTTIYMDLLEDGPLNIKTMAGVLGYNFQPSAKQEDMVNDGEAKITKSDRQPLPAYRDKKIDVRFPVHIEGFLNKCGWKSGQSIEEFCQALERNPSKFIKENPIYLNRLMKPNYFAALDNDLNELGGDRTSGQTFYPYFIRILDAVRKKKDGHLRVCLNSGGNKQLAKQLSTREEAGNKFFAKKVNGEEFEILYAPDGVKNLFLTKVLPPRLNSNWVTSVAGKDDPLAEKETKQKPTVPASQSVERPVSSGPGRNQLGETPAAEQERRGDKEEKQGVGVVETGEDVNLLKEKAMREEPKRPITPGQIKRRASLALRTPPASPKVTEKARPASVLRSSTPLRSPHKQQSEQPPVLDLGAPAVPTLPPSSTPIPTGLFDDGGVKTAMSTDVPPSPKLQALVAGGEGSPVVRSRASSRATTAVQHGGSPSSRSPASSGTATPVQGQGSEELSVTSILSQANQLSPEALARLMAGLQQIQASQQADSLMPVANVFDGDSNSHDGSIQRRGSLPTAQLQPRNERWSTPQKDKAARKSSHAKGTRNKEFKDLSHSMEPQSPVVPATSPLARGESGGADSTSSDSPSPTHHSPLRMRGQAPGALSPLSSATALAKKRSTTLMGSSSQMVFSPPSSQPPATPPQAGAELPKTELTQQKGKVVEEKNHELSQQSSPLAPVAFFLQTNLNVHYYYTPSLFPSLLGLESSPPTAKVLSPQDEGNHSQSAPSSPKAKIATEGSKSADSTPEKVAQPRVEGGEQQPRPRSARKLQW